jgi:alpha-beta hydrolase superfamily lysophospholipase
MRRHDAFRAAVPAPNPVVRAMNPAVGSVVPTRIEVRLGRGEMLSGRLWAADEPRGLVVILHGIGEHCGRYAAFASDLATAGYTVASADLPGHGESSGPRGDVRSWTTVRDNAVHALWTAPLALPGDLARLPRILFGHSMGAVLALDYALSHPRDLTAVVATAAALRSAMPPWWKLALANVARVTSPAMGFPTGLEEAGMSRDPEVVRARADDPLVHDRCSPRLYFAFNEARQRVLRGARRLAVPALLMHGDADRVVDPAGSAEFAAAAPHGLLTHIVYPGAYHEILNDLDRPKVERDMFEWLEHVLQPAPTARR